MEKVGYLGPDNVTFGFMTAERYFLESKMEFVPFENHYKICEAVGKGNVEYGVVAIENVIDGVVAETIHAVEHIFRKHGLCIFAETELPIKLFYFQMADANIKPTKVLSHLTALRQCQKFISSLQGQGLTVEVRNSTGQAAKEASNDPMISVIASEKAETIYNLKRLVADSVADQEHNFTRFWILSKKQNVKTGHDKTCILINLEQQESGGFCRALECFAKKQVNLLTVCPNPIPGRKWEYTFVLEFAGHILDENVDSAYEALSDSGVCVGGPLLLGSYPVST